MPLELTLEEQEVLADTRRRARLDPTRRELIAEVVLGVGLIAAIAALWAAVPPGPVEPLTLVLTIAVTVLATGVSFDTPFGFTSATQLAFVPLLFALPLAIVPVAVAVALVLARIPDVIAGRRRPLSLLLMPNNAWFAIGPVAVFAAAGEQPATAGAWILLFALGAQFAVDFTTSALVMRFTRGASLRSQLGDSWVYLIDGALSFVAMPVARDITESALAALAIVPLLGLLAMFAHERRGRLENLLELNETYRGTALLLGDVISADDGYTGEHSEGVVGLALEVGRALGLSAERIRNLEFGALLHDVGKITIPKAIINKPGKLDPSEWDIIKTHTIEGQRMLDHVGGFMREVGLIVRSHHERWDGGGYPDGLAGDKIPIESRIITCCDSWNAMRTTRSYRAAMTIEAALAEIHTNTGTQFDPAVVAALLEIVTREQEQPEPVSLSQAEPAQRVAA